MGDLGDLRRTARWAKQLGAGLLLINPLCAAAPVLPQAASPYYPASRRFLNPLYLNIEDVAERVGAAPSEFSDLAARGRELNAERRIDRDAVFRLKNAALSRFYPRGLYDTRCERFRAERRRELSAFAEYCTLAEEHGADFRRWPLELQDRSSPEFAEFRTRRAERIRYHEWLQWLLDEQLAAAGAELPLVTDLPVGVDPGGADAWAWRGVLAEGVTVGAPPDHFNVRGQDWGLPPWSPSRLYAAAYEPFIQTVRAALRHAGGLRIDHVMGLFRLFWIPAGQAPTAGAYVRYPAEDLLDIVALESQRAGAWVAGEDLGTVEPSVRQSLLDRGMLSYRLASFESAPPREYPWQALAAITTHDLPTVAGAWTGGDSQAQRAAGLSPNEAGEREIRERFARLARLPPSAPPAEAVEGVYRALGESPSAVLVATLDDALAVNERPNLPGTLYEWPNWSLALPAPLEELERAELPRRIAAALRREG